MVGEPVEPLFQVVGELVEPWLVSLSNHELLFCFDKEDNRVAVFTDSIDKTFEFKSVFNKAELTIPQIQWHKVYSFACSE
jgi:hypothetical protein